MAEGLQADVLLGMAGVTLIVPDVDRAARAYTDTLGLEPFRRGQVGAAEAIAWGVDPGSVGPDYVLLRAPKSDNGLIRLVGAAPTEPAALEERGRGWAAIEFVTNDVNAVLDKMAASPGFSVLTPAGNIDLTSADSLLHRSFLGRGPGGVTLIFTQALGEPRGRRFPRASGLVGHVFNSVLRTDRAERTRGFYVDDLGMVPFLETQLRDAVFNSLLGLPPDMCLDLRMVRGGVPGTGRGSIEIQSYPDGVLAGRRSSARTLPQGLAIVTYVARDVESAFHLGATSRGRCLADSPVQLAEGGLGFALLGTEGERLEIVAHNWTVSA